MARLESRNFGAEAKALRLRPCLIAARIQAGILSPRVFAKPCAISCKHVIKVVDGVEILGSEATHAGEARKMGGCGGGRFDILNLCTAHHNQASEPRTAKRAIFEEIYEVDCRLEADLIALAWDAPLGIRGLVQRWVVENFTRDDADHVPLTDYEYGALFGVVARKIRREGFGAAAESVFDQLFGGDCTQMDLSAELVSTAFARWK